MPEFNEEQKALLDEISELFKNAEKRLKRSERIESLTFPAVNQLRYVSYHLLRAWNSEDPEKITDELRKAKYHCQRAIYDAVEICIVSYLEEIKTFKKDYQGVPIANDLPDYIEIFRRAQAAHDLILTRTDHSVEAHCDAGSENYKEADLACEELAKIIAKLDLARPELNKRQRNEFIKILVAVCGTLFAFIGVIIALAVACL